MRKTTRLMLFTALAVAVTVIIQGTPPAKVNGSGSGQAQIGGSFSLTDQTGKPFSSDSLKGKFSLIFMGYSNCPDICPMALYTMSDTLKKLGDSADNLHVVFISVDSRNDTPEKLSEYLRSFDSRIIALTGNEADIKAVLAAYKGYAKQPENPAPGNNLISHSGWIYLMDREGHYVRHFDSGVKADVLAEAVNTAIRGQ